MTTVLGIDIGVGGALAILEDGELVDAVDMPVLCDGPAKRRSISAPLLAELIARSHATLAFIEYVGARPGEGPTGAFAFGRAKGCR
jgi:crossover junction endodeoxyribonuclease RuvC